jgi:folate-binding protein YgfZ
MTNTNISSITPLTDWTLIHINGPDSESFLQNLFTNNILNLPLGSEHLSGFCSPKGRLLASFWVSHSSKENYDLWISKDIAPEFVKKLLMYKLRSKVEIILLDPPLQIYGEVSNVPFKTTSNKMCNLPAVLHEEIRYNRRVIAEESNDIEQTQESNVWSILEVASGIPRITANTKDLFVPQMINFESIGGVDFKKGCYPGQEIVARSQYLGHIKRRLKIGSIAQSTDLVQIIPGTEVYSESDPDQSCGVVVLSSLDSSKERYYLQIEIKLSELKSNLYFKTDDGKISAFIQIEEPPYPLLTI